jgi:hypothetical protein
VASTAFSCKKVFCFLHEVKYRSGSG